VTPTEVDRTRTTESQRVPRGTSIRLVLKRDAAAGGIARVQMSGVEIVV
jgi:hypothetical protein